MKMTSLQSKQRQRGAVSLFVVVFVTLLMIVITISFIQLMMKDQQQASASDLSQSAYDSAQSGVEDAKRLLLLEQACRSSAPPAGTNCNAVKAAIASDKCDTVSSILNPGSTETLIQQTVGDVNLKQAYTCVKIVNAPDYKGILKVNNSNIIPLNAQGPFDAIEISWFTRDDIATTNSVAIGFPKVSGPVKLPRAGTQWDEKTPSLLRTQFMQTGDSFKLSDFDTGPGNNKSNANTLFLYPAVVGAASMNFSSDARRDPANAPQLAKCNTSFSNGESYACTTTINLPAPISGSAAARGAFLRLSSLYNGAHYKIKLINAGNPQPFDHVQAEVDSTGRANDMFRRVKSRVELKSDFIYPEAAVDIEGDLCKSFVITNNNAQYQLTGVCAP